MSHFFKNRIDKKGFTLPEMLISLGIVGIIMSVVLTNQTKYTEGTAITNVVDTMSLYVSQAQIYGVSVKELGTGSSQFNASYGVDFRLPSAGGSDSAYIFFADRNGDALYSDSWSCPETASSECQEKIDINNNNVIDSLCIIYIDETESCDLGRISVAFTRPNTRARMYLFNSVGSSINPSDVKGVKVNVLSQNGLNRSISIFNTGYVSTQ